jgi:hypothetical protein
VKLYNLVINRSKVEKTERGKSRVKSPCWHIKKRLVSRLLRHQVKLSRHDMNPHHIIAEHVDVYV